VGVKGSHSSTVPIQAKHCLSRKLFAIYINYRNIFLSQKIMGPFNINKYIQNEFEIIN